MNKPEVGQTLYSLNIGNAARGIKQVLKPVIVKSVGRKYFTVGKEGATWMDTQYYLDDWSEKTDYSANSYLYRNQREYKDEKEARIICAKINKSFEYGKNVRGLSLESLRQIQKILERGAERGRKCQQK